MLFKEKDLLISCRGNIYYFRRYCGKIFIDADCVLTDLKDENSYGISTNLWYYKGRHVLTEIKRVTYLDEDI